jgi:hypothetical protein
MPDSAFYKREGSVELPYSLREVLYLSRAKAHLVVERAWRESY